MSMNREEKEKKVLDLYYTKGYTYRKIAEELRMSPNQIREITRRHEEKNDAIVSRKKMLSLSSKAYQLFSKGKTNVEVAIKLDIPQAQATQFRLEYWRLQDQDDLESLHIVTKGKARHLWKLYQKLVIEKGMSLEAVANVVDIALDRLPSMEDHLDQAIRAAARKQEKVEYLQNRIHSLEEKEEKKKRMITLPSSYYHVEDREDPTMKVFSSNLNPRQPSQLPYWPTEDYDPWSEYRNKNKTR